VAIACDVESQPSHFSVVFLMRQLTLDEAPGNGFSLRTGLKSFNSYTGKAIFHRFGAQLPLFAIDLWLAGKAISCNNYQLPEPRPYWA
jgi:hypothetical protein